LYLISGSGPAPDCIATSRSNARGTEGLTATLGRPQALVTRTGRRLPTAVVVAVIAIQPVVVVSVLVAQLLVHPVVLALQAAMFPLVAPVGGPGVFRVPRRVLVGELVVPVGVLSPQAIVIVGVLVFQVPVERAMAVAVAIV